MKKPKIESEPSASEILKDIQKLGVVNLKVDYMSATELKKRKAINEIRFIQSGIGINKDSFPDSMKGSLAIGNWRDEKFSLGMEYGYILALMEAFEITEEEL